MEIAHHSVWTVLSASFLAIFMAYGITLGYTIVLPQMMENLAITNTQAGLIFTAYMLGYILFSPLAGKLSDRRDGHIVISGFSIIMGIGATLMGTVTNFWAGVAFFFFVGAGVSSIWIGSTTIIQRWFTAGWRGKALGILSAGAPVGYGTMSVLLPAVTEMYGWRVGWYLVGLISIAIGLVGFALLRSDPLHQGLRPWGPIDKSREAAEPKKHHGDSKSFLRRLTFWLVQLSYFCKGFSTYAFLTFLVTFAYTELRLPYSISSMLLGAMALGGVFGATILSSTSDYLGRRTMLIICNVAAALSILSVLASAYLIVLLASTVAFGFFNEGVYPMYAACSSDYFSKQVSGRVLGVWTLGYGMSALISPALSGFLADTYGTFYWSFVISGLAVAIAAVLLVPIHEGKAS